MNLNYLSAIYASYLEQNHKENALCGNIPEQVTELLLFPLNPIKEILNPYYGTNKIIAQTSFYWRQLEQGTEMRIESWNPKTETIFCCNMKSDQLEIKNIPLTEWMQGITETFDYVM